MIRKMRSEDKKTYMEMAREFYHSDAVLHPVPDTYFERTADEALRSDVYAEIFLFDFFQLFAAFLDDIADRGHDITGSLGNIKGNDGLRVSGKKQRGGK